MCTPKGKTHSRRAEKTEDFRMNEKTARQIAEMKTQTKIILFTALYRISPGAVQYAEPDRQI